MMSSLPIHQLSDVRDSGYRGQHNPRLLRVNKSALSRTANPVQQRPLRSFSPSLTLILRDNAIGASVLIQPRPA
jgi:hypothetical protein